jgi:hypothetical protein
MDLLQFYPSPDDLIENELGALEYLSGNTYIAGEQSQFVNHARLYFSQYRYSRHGFRFASYFDVVHAEMPRARGAKAGRPQPNLRLIVAAQIDQDEHSDYSDISYALVVCRIRPKRPSILRKFHFDVVATDSPSRRQAHPICHLQYCGKMIPVMGDMGFSQSQLQQLHSNLSEPRLFFWPMSLALLIDMALHEFPDPESEKFRAAPEWRKIVRENEKLLLHRFHEKCAEIIADRGERERTLADEFYVR